MLKARSGARPALGQTRMERQLQYPLRLGGITFQTMYRTLPLFRWSVLRDQWSVSGLLLEGAREGRGLPWGQAGRVWACRVRGAISVRFGVTVAIGSTLRAAPAYPPRGSAELPKRLSNRLSACGGIMHSPCVMKLTIFSWVSNRNFRPLVAFVSTIFFVLWGIQNVGEGQ